MRQRDLIIRSDHWFLSNHPLSIEVIRIKLSAVSLCITGVTLQTDGQKLDRWRNVSVSVQLQFSRW